MRWKGINKFYTAIKMLILRETCLMVKDFMEENDTNVKELIKSMICKKIPVTITCDGVTKKFYSLAFAC